MNFNGEFHLRSQTKKMFDLCVSLRSAYEFIGHYPLKHQYRQIFQTKLCSLFQSNSFEYRSNSFSKTFIHISNYSIEFVSCSSQNRFEEILRSCQTQDSYERTFLFIVIECDFVKNSRWIRNHVNGQLEQFVVENISLENLSKDSFLHNQSYVDMSGQTMEQINNAFVYETFIRYMKNLREKFPKQAKTLIHAVRFANINIRRFLNKKVFKFFVWIF